MKKLWWVVVAAMLVLSACGPIREPFHPGGIQGFDPVTLSKPVASFPNVWVIDNGIVVDQEPVRFRNFAGDRIAIVWLLPRATPGANYTFPEDGITIKFPPGSNPRVECGVQGELKKRYRCVFDKPMVSPGQVVFYKYVVKVMNGATALTPLDPQIMID